MTPLPFRDDGRPDPLTAVFLERDALTRSEVIELTGHARSTVGPRMDRMSAQGILQPAASGVSTGGRRPTSFALNPAYASFLVVDMGPGHTRVAITDLRGRVLVDRREPTGMGDDPDEAFSLVSRLVQELHGYAGPAIVGTAVSVPSPIDQATGKPRRPPGSPLWDGYDIPRTMMTMLPVPVTVERNSQLRALGEYTLDRVGNADMLYIHASTWVGAGAIAAGRLLHGSTGEVGHLGHVKADWTEDDACMCGNRGCLEAVASGLSLIREFGASRSVMTTAGIVEVARTGDTALLTAIREVGRKIGLAAAGYVSVLNPGRIVLGGTLATIGFEFASGVREGVHSRAFPLTAEEIEVVTSAAGADAAIIGAASLALDTYVRHGVAMNGVSNELVAAR